jgi:hypothetical protein
MLSRGEIPEGMCVLHKCDVRRCVRPDHLFLGTNAENTADMIAKDRECRGERNPLHKLTNEQINEIRGEYARGGITQRDLGARFGVHQSEVSRIVRGLLWKKAA